MGHALHHIASAAACRVVEAEELLRPPQPPCTSPPRTPLPPGAETPTSARAAAPSTPTAAVFAPADGDGDGGGCSPWLLALLSGSSSPLDVREVPSHLMEHALREPRCLALLSRHGRLDCPLPQRDCARWGREGVGERQVRVGLQPLSPPLQFLQPGLTRRGRGAVRTPSIPTAPAPQAEPRGPIPLHPRAPGWWPSWPAASPPPWGSCRWSTGHLRGRGVWEGTGGGEGSPGPEGRVLYLDTAAGRPVAGRPAGVDGACSPRQIIRLSR
jgi:hypothetical protein